MAVAGTLEIQLLANIARLQKDMDDAKRSVWVPTPTASCSRALKSVRFVANRSGRSRAGAADSRYSGDTGTASSGHGACVMGVGPTSGATGRGIGTLFVAWLVLAQVLKQRWAGKVLEDERDMQIELIASQWGRGATTVCIIAIAVLLGFSDTGRLREFSYPFIAQMLMLALLWGLWFDQLVAAILYWRDRRAVRQLEGGAQ